MSWIDSITPSNTEEVKPNLFIKKTRLGYRQVFPSAWDGKVNWRNFILGGHPARNLMWFLIIVFLAWSYAVDTKNLREFYNERFLFCEEVQKIKDDPALCTDFQRKQGLCQESELDLSGFGVFNEQEDT